MAKSFKNQQTGRKLEGYDNVMRNLTKEIRKIKNRSTKGLLKAAILIRRDMDTTPPLIPVATGNMRASSFIVAGSGHSRTGASFKGEEAGAMQSNHSSMISKVTGKVSGKLVVAIGFSAYYSGIVEADTTTRRQRPGSGGGFFEAAIQRNKPFIIDVIKKERR